MSLRELRSSTVLLRERRTPLRELSSAADQVASLAAAVEDEESDDDGNRNLIEPVEPIPADQLDCEGELRPGVVVRCTTPLGESRGFILLDPDTLPPVEL